MSHERGAIKVYLCHAPGDETTALALYLRLIQDGVDAWLNSERLLPGQDRELEIARVVRESDAVVVCLSNQFNQAGYQHKEVRLALDTAMEQPEGEIFIIPARLEECGIPHSLRKWQWVDLFRAGGYERIIGALRALALSKGAPSPESKSGDSQKIRELEREIGGNDMENWTCSHCRALNPPRRNKCWKCGNSRPGRDGFSVMSTQPALPEEKTAPQKQKKRSSQSDTAITVAIIGLIGTMITAIFASPVLSAFIQRLPVLTDTPFLTPSLISALTTTPTTSISSTETPSLTSLELKIEYGQPFDPRGYFPHSLYLLLPGPPTGVIGWPETENYEAIAASKGNIMIMSVTNQSSQIIILNNKIPIEVNRQPSTTLAHVWDMEGGGGQGYYRNFVTTIPTEVGQQTIWAVFEENGPNYAEAIEMTPDPPINQPDFFTLAPGETEIFRIEVKFDAPGDYTLRPGIEFAENGKAVRAWTPDVISTSIPENIIVWSEDASSRELVKDGTCHFTDDMGLTPTVDDPHNDYICDS